MANELRAFRSRTVLTKMLHEIQAALPGLVSPDGQAAFVQFVHEQKESNTDAAHFLEEVGLESLDIDPTHGPGPLLTFAASLLAKLSSAPRPWARGCAILVCVLFWWALVSRVQRNRYIYIYI